MNWTQSAVEQAATLYQNGHTAGECAARMKISAANMRKVFSLYGVPSPETLRNEKDRRLALKFTGFGWSIHEIAEQLDRPVGFVRRALNRATYTQLTLWPDTEFRVPAPPPRIAHWSGPKRSIVCVQLRLDFGDGILADHAYQLLRA